MMMKGGGRRQTYKKFIFVREPNVAFKDIRIIHFETLYKFRVVLVIGQIYLFQPNYLKITGFFSKNVRELGSQFTNFMHVWEEGGCMT